MRRNLTLTALSLLALLVGACGDDGRDPAGPGPNPPDPPGTTAPEGSVAIVGQTSAVSECGGFGESRKSQGTFSDAAAGYCDAEVLAWSFDAKTGTLALRNDRVVLNCCGEHTIEVSKQGDTFVITETDAPDSAGGRCHCMCVFDFSVEVKLASAAGKIEIKLVREVTDSGEGPKEQLSATIDLDATEGHEVVDSSDAGPWCDSATPPEPAPEQVTHTFELSECGGFGTSDGSNATDYCDAERLQWSYDATTKKLRLTDSRVLLNCCGERSITVTQQDGVYVVTELDEAGAAGRCYCQCVFDLATTIEGVPEGEIKLRLLRGVHDEGTATEGLLFDGALDLKAGSGSEVLDTTDATPWCETE